MEKLSSYLGFEARFIVYPLVALLAGAILKLVIRRYALKRGEKTTNELSDQIIGYLDNMTTPLVLMGILYGLSHWLPLPAKSVQYLQKGVLIVITFLVAYICSRLVTTVIAHAGERRDNWKKFLQPFRALAKVFFILVAAAITFRILDVSMSSEGIRLVRIIGIVAGAYVVLRVIKLAVSQVESIVEQKDSTVTEAQKRAKTLGKIVNNAASIIVIGVSVMMVLSEFGMNIAPIITGAGIVGLAVGFGAQNLVRDVISGFFLILEDQVRVGDVANINGTSGTVEAIRLRTTILRDAQGTVYTFPNGEIKLVANLTKEYSYAVVDIGVAYKENVDDVMAVLRQIGDSVYEDPKFKPLILAPVEVPGIEGFGDSQVNLRVRMKTLPLQQWGVARELRRRIKIEFDRRGIEIPFPHTSVYFGEASKPVELMVNNAGMSRKAEN